MRPAYRKLKKYLVHSDLIRVDLRMDDIESLIGRPLPIGARQIQKWWTAGSHYWLLGHANAWSSAGYKVSIVSLDGGWVRFRKNISKPQPGKRMLSIASVGAIFFLITLALWLVPKITTSQSGLTGASRASAENDSRTTLIAFFIALGAAGTLVYTARTYTLGRESHVTERITNAVEQLGHTSPSVRLGGILALSRIAEDSPRDAPAVVSILCQYARSESKAARRHASWSRPIWHDLRFRRIRRYIDPSSGLFAERGRSDIQAAVSQAASLSVRLAPLSLQLAGLQLDGAMLSSVVAHEATLDGSSIRRAYLSRSDLRQSWIRYAELQGSWFNDALLQGADFSYSRLENADFTGANLEGASFYHAHLAGAKFEDAQLAGADFRQATGLTKKQLQKSTLNYSTKVPWP